MWLISTLAPGLKRITLVKDPDKGIGCTIKNAAGHILVNRILEDGPIAITGVLRPGVWAWEVKQKLLCCVQLDRQPAANALRRLFHILACQTVLI